MPNSTIPLERSSPDSSLDLLREPLRQTEAMKADWLVIVKAHHEMLERAFNELRSLNETVSVMSARLDAFGERAEVEPKVAMPANLNAQRGYDVATRLAKQGASVEDLVSNCGITRHEAELLTRLHGPKARPTPSPAWQRATAKTEAPQPAQWPVQQQAREEAPQPKSARKRGSLVSVVG